MTVGVETLAVARLNFWEVVPAGTVTVVDGNAVVDPDRVTIALPLETAELMVTVTTRGVPPTTEVLETPTERILRGERRTLAAFADAPSVAVTVTVCDDGIVPAVAEKVAVLAPAATVTEAGTVSRVLLSDKVTETPPVGAALESVTVQVAAAPELMLVGAQTRDETRTGAVRLRVAVLDCPFRVAVMVAD